MDPSAEEQAIADGIRAMEAENELESGNRPGPDEDDAGEEHDPAPNAPEMNDEPTVEDLVADTPILADELTPLSYPSTPRGLSDALGANDESTTDSAAEPQLNRYEICAWIVDETLRGNRVTPSSLPRTREHRAKHLRFQHSLWLRQLCALVLVMLSFFETPAWCGRDAVCAITGADGQPANLYLSGLPQLSPFTASVIEAVALGVLVWYAYQQKSLLRAGSAAEANFPYLVLTLGLLVADCLFAILMPAPPFRAAPMIRAFLPLFYWRSLADMASGCKAVLVPFADVTLFWVIFVVFFGWLFTLLFHDVDNADRYFGTLTTGIYSSFTSMTGADWPMQVMAILDYSRPSALIFLFYIVIGIFLLFNTILAVVYNAFTEHVEKSVYENTRIMSANLRLAYLILCPAQSQTLEMPRFKMLVDALCQNNHFRGIKSDQLNLIFVAIDDNGDRMISMDEFVDVLNVLELQFEEMALQKKSWAAHLFPALAETETWKSVMSFARSRKFEATIDIIMLVNVIVVVIESTMDLKDQDTPESVMFFGYLEVAFSAVYVFEMLFKTAAMSFRQYWKSSANRFDFMVTILLLVGGAYVITPFGDNDPLVVRYLVCLRCLRLLALLSDIPRFRNLVQVFSVLVPASAPLFALFALTTYFFAALGVQLFGGLIHSGTPALNPDKNELIDAFVGNDYWTLNCNDMAAAFFMLFSAVVVCYLTEVPAAIASTSKYGGWTYWFFIAAFAVNTLIVSNVVVALVVDLFVDAKESLSASGDDAQNLENLRSRYDKTAVRVFRTPRAAQGVFASMFREQIRDAYEAESLQHTEDADQTLRNETQQTLRNLYGSLGDAE